MLRPGNNASAYIQLRLLVISNGVSFGLPEKRTRIKPLKLIRVALQTMIKLLLWFLWFALLTTTEAYLFFYRHGKDDQSFSTRHTRRPTYDLLSNHIVPPATHIISPLTLEQCRQAQFSQLRACRLDRAMLSILAGPHMCRSRDGFHPNHAATIQHSIGRKKRYVKPCSGTKRRVAVLQAKDRTGILRELVTDPNNYLYQTIVVENCPSGPSGQYGLHCRQHSITFLAAVFPTNPHSNTISAELVSTPAFCALSF